MSIINPEDIVITAWSSKPIGGFSMRFPNGVQIVHLPTGSVVSCDSERSPHQNRAKALASLEFQLTTKELTE